MKLSAIANFKTREVKKTLSIHYYLWLQRKPYYFSKKNHKIQMIQPPFLHQEILVRIVSLTDTKNFIEELQPKLLVY